MSRSDQVIFLLGAGSSKWQSLPVMSEFLGVVRRRVLDDYKDRIDEDPQKQALQELLAFYRQCRSSSHAVNRDWDNIEELYTQADLRRIAGIPNKASAEELCSWIAWALWDIYRTDDASRIFGVNAGMLNQIAQANLSPAFITTNYDVVAERGITQSKHPHLGRYIYFYPGFERPFENDGTAIGKFDSSQELQPSPNYVPVVKLHGSVNWVNAGADCYAVYDKGLLVNPDQYNQRRTLSDKHLLRREFVEGLRDTQEIDSDVQLSPAIVPPMLGKSSDVPAICFQWHEAIKLMGRARQLWIVGYSFPQTDAFMSRLLCEGIQDCLDLDFVAVANVEPEQDFAPRLQQLFNPTFYKNKVRYFQIRAEQLFAILSSQVSDWNNVLDSVKTHLPRKL